MNHTTLFSILFVILIGAIGYLWYSYSQVPDNTAPVLVQEEFARSITQAARLRKIDIDTTIFDDPAFTSLVAPPQLPEPGVTPGRLNPFLGAR